MLSFINREVLIIEYNYLEGFIERNQWEAIEYYKGLQEKMALLCLSYDLLIKGKSDSEKNILVLKNKKECELEQKGKAYLMQEDILSSKPSILGLRIKPLYFFKKLVGEVIQYSLMIGDMYLQLINSCILHNSLDSEKVTLRAVKDKLLTTEDCGVVSSFINELENDSIYKYTRHLGNYIKHIHSVPLSVKLNGDYIYEVWIKDFTHGKESFLQEDAFKEAKEIIDYFQATTAKLLTILHDTSKPFIDRVSKIPMFLMKDDEERIRFVSFFIDIEDRVLDVEKVFGGETIEVRPMLRYQGRIYEDVNFRCEVLFIRVNGTTDEIIGKAERINECKSIYRIQKCDKEEYYKYRMDFSAKKVNVVFNSSAHEGIFQTVKRGKTE